MPLLERSLVRFEWRTTEMSALTGLEGVVAPAATLKMGGNRAGADSPQVVECHACPRGGFARSTTAEAASRWLREYSYSSIITALCVIVTPLMSERMFYRTTLRPWATWCACSRLPETRARSEGVRVMVNACSHAQLKFLDWPSHVVPRGRVSLAPMLRTNPFSDSSEPSSARAEQACVRDELPSTRTDRDKMNRRIGVRRGRAHGHDPDPCRGGRGAIRHGCAGNTALRIRTDRHGR